MTDVRQQLVFLKDNLPSQTRIQLYSFDASLYRGPQLTLGDKESGESLKKYLESLAPTGDQTFLWRCLDQVLEDARQIILTNADATVRVVLLTDGEDNDPQRLIPEKVLEKYADILKFQVRLSYVTLGFEMKEELKKTLVGKNVQVSAALVSDDIIPLDASFRLLPSPAQVGQEVHLVDESIGAAIRFRGILWGDGSPRTNARSPSHRYSKPGEYNVTLGVESATGKRSTYSRKIVIQEPMPPKASFSLASHTLEAGQRVVPTEMSTGPIIRRRWSVSDGRTFDDTTPSLNFDRPGQYAIELEVTGPTGTDKVTHPIEVRPIPAPKAGFTIGTEKPFVGDSFILTATPVGTIDSIAFLVDGQPQVVRKRSNDHVHETVVVKATKSGPLSIRQVVTGPGGTDACEQTVEVMRRAEAPVAKLFTTYQPVRGPTKVKLDNHSTGTVQRCRYDFSDGSESVTLDGVQGYERSFEPGHHRIVLTAFGHTDFSPSVTEIEVDVEKPFPSWILRAFYLGLAVAVAVVLIIVVWMHKRAAFEASERMQLRGHLEVYTGDRCQAYLTSHSLTGQSCEETRQVNAETSVVLRSKLNPESSEVDYELELLRLGESVKVVDIEPNSICELGEFAYRFANVA